MLTRKALTVSPKAPVAAPVRTVAPVRRTIAFNERDTKQGGRPNTEDVGQKEPKLPGSAPQEPDRPDATIQGNLNLGAPDTGVGKDFIAQPKNAAGGDNLKADGEPKDYPDTQDQFVEKAQEFFAGLTSPKEVAEDKIRNEKQQ